MGRRHQAWACIMRNLFSTDCHHHGVAEFASHDGEAAAGEWVVGDSAPGPGSGVKEWWWGTDCTRLSLLRKILIV